MWKFYSLLLMTVFSLQCFGQKVDYSSKLIGSWSYVESRDEQGKKIEPDNGIRILMNEPNLFYSNDFNYKKIFTPENSDTGKWKFNSKTMTIEHDLFIDSTDFIGKDLIKQGLAKKQKDGKYYQKDDSKVLKLTDKEMIIQGTGIQVVYKKEK
ncbi:MULTISPECIES: hypothetical protein [Flavobacterium]|uniref:Lipocalin-like domain-containing protein n=1 Tax=Flavobacterium hankyongi TaxID=1176532 RepID=A0ABP9AA22_9FLAO|nr:hypothetical protein [Flavobacterium sp. N1846]